jgi:CBS domain containing-hemolysin-like protein
VGEHSASVIAIGLCVLGAAFFAAAETALTAIGEARTRQLIDAGHTSLQLWLERPERVLATLLVGNTLVMTLSSTLMMALVHQSGASNGVAIATGLETVLLLALGEVTPKALARQFASTVAPLTMPLVKVVYYLFYPAVHVLSEIPRAISRLIKKGETPTSEEHTSITTEEIEYMIDLGVKHGVLDGEKSALLSSVLEFTDTLTREIMVPRVDVVAVPISATREELLKVVVDSEHSRIPVYEGSIDEVVGVLYVKNLLADLRSEQVSVEFDIRRYMKPAFFVPELMKISRLLREFQRRKVHIAVVVDEFGGTAGVVALEDVVEEIVGEIQDEQDVEEGRIRQLGDGTVIADAGVHLRDLEDVLKIDFPDEIDYDSLGGFVTDQAGKVPPPGSVVLWKGLRFTVRAGDERRVTRVEIVRAPETPAVPAGEVRNEASDVEHLEPQSDA